MRESNLPSTLGVVVLSSYKEVKPLGVTSGSHPVSFFLALGSIHVTNCCFYSFTLTQPFPNLSTFDQLGRFTESRE